MHTETHRLHGSTPGLTAELTVWRFGTPGRGPKATVQAALHADEVPALLVAQALKAELLAAESEGRLRGEVVLVPVANPLGLAQRVLGHHEGRFHLADGVNFNRGHAELAEAAASRLAGQLGDDPAANVRQVRQALVAAATALPAVTPVEHLKRRLLLTAIDSDIVLDLHCDNQAVMHLYALTPHEALADELGALLGAQAVLLADESGDSPFDEACSRPWVQLQQHFPAHPIPPACFAPTVELRGECDTDWPQARQDAAALMAFLHRRGLLHGQPPTLPPPQCRATPLAGSEPVVAPHAGVVIFHAEPGQRVRRGQTVATLVDVADGRHTALAASTDGVLYARESTRWAQAGQRLCKVAGATATRTGRLLSA